VLPSGQKVTLALLATIALKVALFHRYAPLAYAIFLNASCKSCSMKVFSTTRDSAYIISVVSKWRAFSFIFDWGNRKVGWVGIDSYVVFGQKFPGEERSVRQCVFMMPQPVLLSPKFMVKSSHNFMQLA
jgi:hypothetical protein